MPPVVVFLIASFAPGAKPLPPLPPALQGKWVAEWMEGERTPCEAVDFELEFREKLGTIIAEDERVTTPCWHAGKSAFMVEVFEDMRFRVAYRISKGKLILTLDGRFDEGIVCGDFLDPPEMTTIVLHRPPPP